MYGWDPGFGGSVLILGGLIVIALILWLDYWVVRNAPDSRGR